jgi:hypothetical protein
MVKEGLTQRRKGAKKAAKIGLGVFFAPLRDVFFASGAS